MERQKFIKYSILMLFLTIILNVLLFSSLPEEVSLIFSLKPNGEMRNNVNKGMAVLLTPILISFSIFVGIINKKYLPIFLLIVGFSIINILIILLNIF